MSIFSKIKKYFTEKILFTDLDGTLIVTKSGKTFPEYEDDLEFKPGILAALISYKPTHLFIVSNQGGIEKGIVPEWEVRRKISKIADQLKHYLPETKIGWTYCASNDNTHPRRKPNTGMLEEFYHDYYGNNDFNKKHALMIGDASGLPGNFSSSDRDCARNFGIKYLDVDYFIAMSDSCDYCGLYKTHDCKFQQDPNVAMNFLCPLDWGLEGWIAEYESKIKEKDD